MRVHSSEDSIVQVTTDQTNSRLGKRTTKRLYVLLLEKNTFKNTERHVALLSCYIYLGCSSFSINFYSIYSKGDNT